MTQPNKTTEPTGEVTQIGDIKFRASANKVDEPRLTTITNSEGHSAMVDLSRVKWIGACKTADRGTEIRVGYDDPDGIIIKFNDGDVQQLPGFTMEDVANVVNNHSDDVKHQTMAVLASGVLQSLCKAGIGEGQNFQCTLPSKRQADRLAALITGFVGVLNTNSEGCIRDFEVVVRGTGVSDETNYTAFFTITKG